MNIMKLSFANLGPLETGTMTLSDLTVLCGANNSGKTYVTYTLYCLLKAIRSTIFLDLKTELSELQLRGAVRIDLETKLVKNWSKHKAAIERDFLNSLPAELAAKQDFFINTSVEFDIDFDSHWKEIQYSDSLRSDKGNVILAFDKPCNSVYLDITAFDSDSNPPLSYGLSQFISSKIVEIILRATVPKVFMASSERTGATIFHRDLNLARNNVVDLLAHMHNEKSREPDFGNVFGTLFKRSYARPVDDNVRYAGALPSPNHEHTEFIKANPELLVSFEKIIGGTYVSNKDGATLFNPRGTKLRLGIGETSSAVRSLLIPWYWLRYESELGGLLMIDEPELNLHPNNQRWFARFIVDLVNAGIRVFLTTHSDTIVREFNTLIMLNNQIEDKELIAAKHGYRPTDGLDPSRMRLYYTGRGLHRLGSSVRRRQVACLLEAVVDPILGVGVDSFDDTIIEMSKVQDELRFGVIE